MQSNPILQLRLDARRDKLEQVGLFSRFRGGFDVRDKWN